MNNNKGFTLTEVLLAAMIVGLIGVALAALTTAALRESGAGRVRLMLRNQASLFLRQLRQDVRESSGATLQGGTSVTLDRQYKSGPTQQTASVTYTCQANGPCSREAEPLLNYVRSYDSTEFKSPSFRLETAQGTDNVGAILHVQLVVGMDTDPVIKEIIDETIVLPQGFAIKKEN